jgi:3-hydroxyisobutyrate dehydrogenase-like beta-hydroxyacid dehydrogenase
MEGSTMTRFSRIALIGFGEVGQILGADLAGVATLSTYDIAFALPESAPSRAVAAADVRAGSNPADAVRGAELVISAVTAAADLDAARSVAGALEPGAVYLDLNSASPGTKQAAAAIIEAAGGRYVEAAVMTPFPPKRVASPMLLGGVHGLEFIARAAPLGFRATVISDEIGPASATKMCRSVIIKGLEALLAESLLTARFYGVEADVLASLSDLLPVGDWPKLAEYMISRSQAHGARRAEELGEVSVTVAEAGVQPLMSRAAAQRQAWAARQPRAESPGLGPMLTTMRAAFAGPDAPPERHAP